MRFRVNVHFDGAPRLCLERHQCGAAWMALHDSAPADVNGAQYVAIFASVLPAAALSGAVDAFNREIDAALQGMKRGELQRVAE